MECRYDRIDIHILGADDAFQENRLNVDFNEDLGHEVRVTKNAACHVIGTRNLLVDFHANSDQNSWYGKHKVVLICLETADLDVDLFSGSLAI